MPAEDVLNRWRSSVRKQPTSFRASNYAWKKFVSLDGENSTYTTVLLICMNLGLLVWVFERGLLQGRRDTLTIDHVKTTPFIKHLIRTTIVVICAAINGLLAFFLLAINLRDLDCMTPRAWRKWLFLSTLGIVGANGLAALVVSSAEQAFRWRIETDKHHENPITHYMILGIFVIFVLILDVLYIRTIYLPFVRGKRKGWDYVRCNLQEILQLGRRERGETSFFENVGYWLIVMVSLPVRLLNAVIFHVFNFWEGVFVRMGSVYSDERSCGGVKEVSRWISEASLAPVRFIRWSPIVQLPLYIIHLLEHLKKAIGIVFRPLSDLLDKARRRGPKHNAPWHHRILRGILLVVDRFIGIFTHFKPKVQRGADELWDSIKEDKNYSHSSWLKAAVVTAVILLIYFGMVMAFKFNGYVDAVYFKHRNCVLSNPGISNFFLRFVGYQPTRFSDNIPRQNVCSVSLRAFDPDSVDISSEALPLEGISGYLGPSRGVATLTDYTRRLESRIQENREEDRVYDCNEKQRSDDVCVLLAAVNMAEHRSHEAERPSDVFFDSFAGRLIYLFDMYMQYLYWTIWIGFIVGLLFGCWTLLSVMGQYKRLSLAIRSGLFDDFDLDNEYRCVSRRQSLLKKMESIVPTHSFATCISQYPMSTSVFFSGMLISTAVLQLVVFGGVVASVFSLIASLTDASVRSTLAPIFWILLAFFITWLVNGPIATFVLAEGLLVSRFQVIHELLFFLFLLIFSSIHLVIGIFLAFFRMFFVLLNSLVMINRLDKNLVTYCRGRDLGNRSFMALVLMQHVFHVNKSGSTAQRNQWREVLAKLEEAEKDELMDSIICSPAVQRRTTDPARLEEGRMDNVDGDEVGGAEARRMRDAVTESRQTRPLHSTGHIVVSF